MECEEKEEHAEHILALGGPGDRFDVDGVQGEQCGHQKTWPGRSGGPKQEQKKENGIRSVKQEIRVVMTGRIQVEELVVERMREPGQRMPVSLAKGCERPLHGIPCQAVLNLGIFYDVRQIIEIDELVADDGIVEN